MLTGSGFFTVGVGHADILFEENGMLCMVPGGNKQFSILEKSDQLVVTWE
jgi:hypothetical protein